MRGEVLEKIVQSEKNGPIIYLANIDGSEKKFRYIKGFRKKFGYMKNKKGFLSKTFICQKMFCRICLKLGYGVKGRHVHGWDGTPPPLSITALGSGANLVEKSMHSEA